MFNIFFAISTIALVSASATKEVRKNFLAVVTLTECDGKDAGNYTLTASYTTDQACSLDSQLSNDDTSLVLIGPHGQKTVNNLKILAAARFSAGAYTQFETLYVALSGNLEGKYVYKKGSRLHLEYFKKCSSVLGYSYVSSNSMSVLIADKLDINVLISPQGGYEAFKRGCTTVCSGQHYVV